MNRIRSGTGAVIHLRSWHGELAVEKMYPPERSTVIIIRRRYTQEQSVVGFVDEDVKVVLAHAKNSQKRSKGRCLHIGHFGMCPF